MNKKFIIILSILGVLLGVSLFLGISYAYYIVSVSQTNKNIVKTSCLNLSISNEENVIKLEKQIPIRNEEGKSLTPYTFTITNTCNSFMAYSLNLEELDGSTLSSKYIMTMVNDKTYVNMASLSSTDNYYDSSVESRVLATGSLGANASIDYSLRLWMDEDTPLTSDAMNKSFKSKIVVVSTPTKTVDFDYTGTEQVFTAPVTGTYKLETWGAQGGYSLKDDENYRGGYGGYSSGTIDLNVNDIIYVNVGGKGNFCKSSASGIIYDDSGAESEGPTCGYNGGYNGGGYTVQYTYGNTYYGSGGGATHISKISGLLSTLSNNVEAVLIVSSGGGGAAAWTPKNVNYNHLGGNGGGYIGSSGIAIKSDRTRFCTGGTQFSGGIGGLTTNYINSDDATFGNGGTNNKAVNLYKYGPGGGGGYYGGGTSETTSCGGSGYIGNSLLTNKAMYCYNCEESSEENIKTISTTCAEETPTSSCAKKGNGYARITYIG